MNAVHNRRVLRPCAHLAAIVSTLSVFTPALGQVAWTTDEAQGIARARREDRLLVLFFSFDERRGHKARHNRPDRNREQVRNVFRDPGVASLVNQAFVPVAADFKLNGEIKKKLGSRITRNDVIIATPELKLLAKIDSGKKMTVANVREALESSLKQWGSEVYARDVRPVLSDPKATPTQLKRALAKLRTIGPDGADQDLVTLLGREKLDGGVRVLAFDALAELSTEDAVRELMKQAATYRPAAQALRKCRPRALRTLVTYLKGEPTPEFLLAYRSVAAITHTSAKSDEFWQKADAATRDKELSRIKEVAAKVGE